jgi:glycosyltransferase involved in cell wall biosynthesis
LEKREIKFIYWFAYYNLNAPSVRYRAKYPLDFGKEKFKIKSYLIIPGYTANQILYFLKAYFSALLFQKKDSLIVIQRVRSNYIYATLLKFLVKIRKSNSVFDIDDADYLDFPTHTIHYFAKNCEFISAGSEKIKLDLQQFNRNIYHITSPTPDLGIVKQKRNSRFTIGWIGFFAMGHKDSLFEFVFPAIKELQFQCKLILIGLNNVSDRDSIRAYFEDCDHIEIEIPTSIDWNNESDIQHRIAAFDIGIATLLNNPFQISKSGIKAKQYLNNGIPVLSTNLPENNNVIQDGSNGFLCDSVDDFKEGFTKIKNMSDKQYNGYSEEARKSAEKYNHYKYFIDFGNMINGT